jgi:Sortase and related acyltransferases
MENSFIRMASLSDASSILEIYEPYILHTTSTFEYDPIPIDQFKHRMESIMNQFPWLVYEKDNKILGYAYCSPFHERAAFSWDCECSVYVDSNYHGIGIASSLYEKLFDLIQQQGYYNIYAIITETNKSSIQFHQKFGFQLDGIHKNVGYKFGTWLGVALLSKAIGDFGQIPSPVKSIHDLLEGYSS